ncbi:hypothetical protein DL93DRAFT_2162363 [Clavulina sp. PMI_390]|nr:hypothetical protein DL93DRAFT_2162363 [Clavulina sp. PMI_390]
MDLADRLTQLKRKQAAAAQASATPKRTERPAPLPVSSPGAGPSSSKFTSATTINASGSAPQPIESQPLRRRLSPDRDFDRGIPLSQAPGRLFDPDSPDTTGLGSSRQGIIANPRGLHYRDSPQAEAMSEASSTGSPRKPAAPRGPSGGPSGAPRRAAPPPPGAQQQSQSRVPQRPADPSRRLFEPNRDDPLRFGSTMTRQAPSQTESQSTHSHNGYLSASSTSDTRSLASSAFTLSSATTGTSVDSGSQPREEKKESTPLVAELKRVYREISIMEKKLTEQCSITETKDEELSRFDTTYTSPSSTPAQIQKWIQLAAAHKELVEMGYRLLEIAKGPSIPASVQSIPDRYNIIWRMWLVGFHHLIITLWRTSATNPAVFEVLSDFIYFAYKFYSEMYERHSFQMYRGQWLEALGDLASYRMMIAAHEQQQRTAAAADITPTLGITASPSGLAPLTQSTLARTTVLGSQFALNHPSHIPTSAAPGFLELPQTQFMGETAPSANAHLNENVNGANSGRGLPQRQSPIPSVGILAAQQMGECDEREIWRNVAREWYALGLKDTPGAGRLQYHLGALSRDVKGDELRTVYHFIKSLIAIHPFDSARERALTYLSPQLVQSLAAPSASAASLFLHIQIQLFTRIDLDQVQPNLARFIERLELDGPSGEEPEWIMMAVLAIGSLLEFGKSDAVLRRACGLSSVPPPSASSQASRPNDSSRPTSWSTDGGSINIAVSAHGAAKAQPWVADQAAAAASGSSMLPIPESSRMEEDDPSNLSRPMQALTTDSPQFEDPRSKQAQMLLNLALEVAFTTLGHLIKTKPYMPAQSDYVKPPLNPYITIMLTFLSTIFKYPGVHPLIERWIPWGALADLLGHALRKANGPSDKDVPLFSTSQLLPEDWALRGMEWTNRRVYERGFWAKPHKGPLGAMVQGEMDVIVASNTIMSPSFIGANPNAPASASIGADGLDGIVEDDDDEEDAADSMDLDGAHGSRHHRSSRRPKLSPAQALGVVRWKRMGSIADMLVRVVPGFRWDPNSLSIVIVEDLADKIALWEQERMNEEEERALAAARQQQLLEQTQMRHRRTSSNPRSGDMMDVDVDEDGFEILPPEEEGGEDVADDDEEDPEDSEQVRELKARRRYLRNLVRMSDRSAPRGVPPPPPPRRGPKPPAPSRPPLKVLPGYTVLVIDTNILLSSLSVVSSLVDSNKWTIIVPLAVITELDGISKNSSPLGNAATDALHYLVTAVPAHRTLKVQTSKGNYLRTLSVRSENIDFSFGSSHDRNMDDLILRSAAWQAEHFYDQRFQGPESSYDTSSSGTSKVVVLSFDRNLRLKARSRKLDAADEKDMGSIMAANSF